MYQPVQITTFQPGALQGPGDRPHVASQAGDEVGSRIVSTPYSSCRRLRATRPRSRRSSVLIPAVVPRPVVLDFRVDDEDVLVHIARSEVARVHLAEHRVYLRHGFSPRCLSRPPGRPGRRETLIPNWRRRRAWSPPGPARSERRRRDLIRRARASIRSAICACCSTVLHISSAACGEGPTAITPWRASSTAGRDPRAASAACARASEPAGCATATSTRSRP